MTNVQSYVAMFRYHLNRPWRVWFLVILLGTQAVGTNFIFTMNFGHSESREIDNMSGYLTVLFSVILTCSFIGSSATTQFSSWAWLLPNAEFLFMRPISRRHIYTPLLVVAFFVLLLCPVLNVVLTAIRHPELRLSLDHPAIQNTEAAQKLAVYQEVFPSSSVVQLPHTNHPILLVPQGETLMAIWTLWQVILVGMVLLALSLIRLPDRMQRWFIVTIACLPAATILSWTWIGPWIDEEKLFFFYLRHSLPIWLLTLAGFALLLRAAAKRIEDVEVR